MDRYNSELNFYNILCDIFTASYSCLYVANQEYPFTAPLVQTRNDIFSSVKTDEYLFSKEKKDWINQKMEFFTKARNEAIEMFEKAKKEYLSQYTQAELFQLNKDYLMEEFNKTFNTNKKYEDCFDGFEILDEQFLELFNLFDKFGTTPADFTFVMDFFKVYYSYLDFYTQYTMVCSAIDVGDKLISDLRPNGYRSMTFGKSTNPDVCILPACILSTIFDSYLSIAKHLDKDIKKSNKKLAKLERLNTATGVEKIVVNVETKEHSSTQAISVEYLNEKLVNTNLNGKNEYVNLLYDILNVLQNRLISSVSDTISTKKDKTIERTYDIIYGLLNSKESELELNSTYVHTLEIDYLKYLFNQLEVEMPFDMLKTLTTEEKEKSQ